MQRLSNREIRKTIRLTKEGFTLNNITKVLDKKKTTVYYHFRKIRGKTFKPVVLTNKDNELIGEFIGLFAGDGYACISNNYNYKTYLFFNITEKIFVKDLTDNVLVKLFGKKPTIFIQKNVLNLCYYSKNIHSLINQYLTWDRNFRKTYSVRLKGKDYPKKFIIGFLRGSLDSDGCFSSRIRFASVSLELIRNISDFLNKLNISHSVRVYKDKRKNRKNIAHVYIPKAEHKKFIKTIRPRNKIKYRAECADWDLNSRMPQP